MRKGCLVKFRENIERFAKVTVVVGSIVALAGISPCVRAVYMPNPFAEVTVDGQEKELRRLENYIDTQATPAERFQLQMQVEQRKFELESAREQEWRMRERSRRRHSRINESNLW